MTEITNVQDIAELVVADLRELGHNDALCWNTADGGCAGGEIMALRICAGEDYHFMKYLRNDDCWYHKPSTTALLKYNYSPTVVLYWTNERVLVGHYLEPTITYNSDIYYIGYGFEHTYAYRYCGNTRHILTCTTCGMTTGSAVSCSMSGNTCRVCGHTSGGGFEIMSLDRH